MAERLAPTARPGRVPIDVVGIERVAKVRRYRTPPYPALSGVFPASSVDAQLAGRDAFYDALAAVAGDVLADLTASCEAALGQTPTPALAFAPPGHLRDVAPAGPCVVAWAVRHNLAVDWLIEDVIQALAEARVCRTPVRFSAHGDPVDLNPALYVGTATVSLAIAWSFASQPRGLFGEMALERLAADLDAELDRIEAEAMAAGAVRREKNELLRHMRWLAMRVCRRLSPAQIARIEHEAPTERAIADAIGSAADLIGLPLPALRRGRPRKRPRAHVVRHRRIAAG